MKLGKIFICINILVLSLLKWPRITSYRFDELFIETENACESVETRIPQYSLHGF